MFVDFKCYSGHVTNSIDHPIVCSAPFATLSLFFAQENLETGQELEGSLELQELVRGRIAGIGGQLRRRDTS